MDKYTTDLYPLTTDTNLRLRDGQQSVFIDDGIFCLYPFRRKYDEEKYMFYLRKISKIFSINLFLSEYINFDVKFKTILSHNDSTKNQNDFLIK